MKGCELPDAIGGIAPEYVNAADENRAAMLHKRKLNRILIPAAACSLIIIVSANHYLQQDRKTTAADEKASAVVNDRAAAFDTGQDS